MLLVDSHCHLDDERFHGDLPDVLNRAAERGVGYMQTICTQIADFPIIHKLALENKNIFCSYGIHPHHALTDVVSEEDILKHGALEKVIGIGETGLDYYYEHSPREAQKESFKRHIRAARKLDLPVIIHTRDADQDTMDLMDEMFAEGPFKALFHCFSSSPEIAAWGLSRGVYFSASGIITFKNSHALREVFQKVPADKLLVETDAPYLAPVPHRGQRCEPAHTRDTAALLADIRNVPLEELAKQTTENFFNLFSKAAR